MQLFFHCHCLLFRDKQNYLFVLVVNSNGISHNKNNENERCSCHQMYFSFQFSCTILAHKTLNIYGFSLFLVQSNNQNNICKKNLCKSLPKDREERKCTKKWKFKVLDPVLKLNYEFGTRRYPKNYSSFYINNNIFIMHHRKWRWWKFLLRK